MSCLKRGITQYDLYTTYNVNRSRINRLKHNKNVEINTIDKLCNILHCRVEDIMDILKTIIYFKIGYDELIEK
ncbi:helix-turn-helix domain-containing protein [Thomasclavelia ramosa]|uniref:helix-turn-helix domain-containing protein n=1 Tax=Thomasclavelia ramosa TaxID=1547 RepID=UPI0036F3F8ED